MAIWRGAIMVLLACALPAAGRDVTGVLAATPTDLAAGAELHVQLVGPAGVVADLRGPARITTPATDMPFTLTTDDVGRLTLQAAIYAGGVPVWVTDGITVPAGDVAVDLGKVALLRPTLPAGRVPLLCGDVAVSVAYAAGQARLARGGVGDLVLTADPANANRFSDGATPDTTLTRLGNRATLILQGTPLPACTPVMPDPLFPLRAQGRDPGWLLVADRTNMALTREDGVTAVAGAAQIRVMADGLAMFAAPDMNLILIDGGCTDGRLPFPVQATLKMPGTTLTGCAGDGLATLAGAWVVDMIAEITMPEDDVVTMAFDGTRVTGYAGCNRYSTQLNTSREGPLLTPPVTTKLSCVGEGMALELGLMAALPRAMQALVNDNGELELRAGDTLLVRAYR